MELHFETYLIIALFFAILTILVAGSFLIRKKSMIGFGALVIMLGFLLPHIVMFFQYRVGSIAEIQRLHELKEFGGDLGDLRHVFITYRSPFSVVYDYYVHNFGFILLSIAAGILAGIAIYWFVTRRWRKAAASTVPGLQS